MQKNRTLLIYKDLIPQCSMNLCFIFSIERRLEQGIQISPFVDRNFNCLSITSAGTSLCFILSFALSTSYRIGSLMHEMGTRKYWPLASIIKVREPWGIVRSDAMIIYSQSSGVIEPSQQSRNSCHTVCEPEIRVSQNSSLHFISSSLLRGVS